MLMISKIFRKVVFYNSGIQYFVEYERFVTHERYTNNVHVFMFTFYGYCVCAVHSSNITSSPGILLHKYIVRTFNGTNY
jgi:hypothetical protein